MKKKHQLHYAAIIMCLAIVILIALSRMFLSSVLHLSEEQAATIAGLGEVVVAAVAAVMIIFQLQQDREIEESQNDIQEAQFILQYNQAFIQDENMVAVEQWLEQASLDPFKNETLITDENRQKFINYLVYLEGLAPLILRKVLRLEHIDDLMSYRFFLAVNNPQVQKDQLFAFPDYYRGCFKLYKLWSHYRSMHGTPILMEESGLDKWPFYPLFSNNDITIRKPTSQRELKAAASVLFGADPYIYPAAFGTSRLAAKAFSQLMHTPENPFYRDNIRIALVDGVVAGAIVAFSDAKQDFAPYQQLRKTCPKLPVSYENACQAYFSGLPAYAKGETYIPCLCVASRFRGKQIGTLLLQTVIHESAGRNVSLHVLADNAGAVSLYEKLGFVPQGEPAPGYAYKKEVPLCIAMTLRQSS